MFVPSFLEWLKEEIKNIFEVKINEWSFESFVSIKTSDNVNDKNELTGRTVKVLFEHDDPKPKDSYYPEENKAREDYKAWVIDFKKKCEELNKEIE